MAEAFFDFEALQTQNFAPIATRQGVVFSPNAIALVSVDAGGEGLFDATANSPPGTTVLSYAEGPDGEPFDIGETAFTLDIRGLAPDGIARGNLSFQYTAPNREHEVEILDAGGNSLAAATLPVTAGRTFDVFRPFSIAIPPDAATVEIGSKATELAIDNLRISVEGAVSLVANPLAASTPSVLTGTEAPDSLDAADPEAIVSLPDDSIDAGVRLIGVSGADNGSATILPGGTAVAFVPLTTPGEGSFNYEVSRDDRTAFSTATIAISEVRAIAGLGGDDTIVGTRGAESLDGGSDNDSIRGDGGNDTLDGGAGSDSLFGEADGDFLRGGGGGDTLDGGAGDDSLFGDLDFLSPDSGDDVLFGGGGNDFFNGGGGDDTLDGGGGDDTSNGDGGDDVLAGRVGDDVLDGEAGDDTLQGDRGADTLSGGVGSDRFSYLSPDDGGTGGDRILDFDAIQDRLVFNSRAVREGGFGLSAVSSETQTLNPAQFVTDAELLSGTFPAVIYDPAIGELRYDPDGSGGGAAIAIAELEAEGGGVPELSPEGIFLVDPVALTLPDPEFPEVVAVEDFATTPAFVNGTEEADTISATAPQPSNALDIPVLLNDSPPGSLAVADVRNITGGSVEFSGVGATVRFTPTLPGGTRGSFIYTASDGTGRDDAAVFVDIIPAAAIAGLGGDDSLVGGGADESLWGDGGDDSLFGNRGSDRLSGGAGIDLLFGGSDADLLFGDSDDDSLFGESGADFLSGGSGSDLLSGGENDDSLFGESGADFLYGGTGSDLLSGGENDDSLFGESGADFLYGGTGLDLLFGGEGDDSLFGESGADFLSGGTGSDLLSGGENDDSLFGESGADFLYGGTGLDLLFGGEGDDFLLGGQDDDSISADKGDDSLSGDGGADTLTGGAGNDTFAYLSRTRAGSDEDRIVDFETGSDRLVFNRGGETDDGFGFFQIGTTPETELSPEQLVVVSQGTYQNGDSSLANPILAYELETGVLKYDPDGSGDRPAEAIAILDEVPPLSVADILLVGTAPEVLVPATAVEDFATTPAFIEGTAEDDSIRAADPSPLNAVEIPILENDTPADELTVLTLDEIAGGEATLLEGDAVEFLPTLPGGTTGGFIYTAIDGEGNTTSAPVTVDIIEATEIDGLAGDDSLVGADGDEFLFGNTGDDVLEGGSGDDSLRGGFGADVMAGGGGNDFFLYQSPDEIFATPLGDTIGDFGTGQDRIAFSDGFSISQFIEILTGPYESEESEVPVSDPILAYERETGSLKYDENGSQPGGIGTVAQLFGDGQTFPAFGVGDIFFF